jgi:hypothetical protein
LARLAREDRCPQELSLNQAAVEAEVAEEIAAAEIVVQLLEDWSRRIPESWRWSGEASNGTDPAASPLAPAQAQCSPLLR